MFAVLTLLFRGWFLEQADMSKIDFGAVLGMIAPLSKDPATFLEDVPKLVHLGVIQDARKQGHTHALTLELDLLIEPLDQDIFFHGGLDMKGLGATEVTQDCCTTAVRERRDCARIGGEVSHN